MAAAESPDKNLTSARTRDGVEAEYQFGPFRLDVGQRVVFEGRTRLALTPKAVDTLRVLVERAGALVSTDTLMAEVWPDAFVEQGSVTRNISALRRALRGRAQIETTSKRGYRLVTAVQRLGPAGPDAQFAVLVGALKPVTPDASLDLMGRAIATALVTKLASVRGCEARLVDAATDRPPAADLVISGAIQLRNRTYRVSVEFHSRPNRSPVWTETLEHTSRHEGALEDAVSDELAGAAALWLSKRHRKLLARRYTRSPQAYHQYLSGHFHAAKRSEGGLKEAIRRFRRSVELDGEYALAYAGLAASYALFPMLAPVDAARYMPKARTAALNALEIDETLAEARAALAFVKWHYDWDWRGAEKEFRRILTFHARDVNARQWLGLLLAERGEFADAIAQATRARRLDPLSGSTRANLATVLLFAGRHDGAIREARGALTLDPRSARARFVLGMALQQQGRLDDAIREFEHALTLSPQYPAVLGSAGHAYARAGLKPKAVEILRRLDEMPHAGAACYAKAVTWLGIGETSQAFAWLEHARVARDFQLVLLRVDRRLDDIRGDGRFKALSRQIGFAG